MLLLVLVCCGHYTTKYTNTQWVMFLYTFLHHYLKQYVFDFDLYIKPLGKLEYNC